MERVLVVGESLIDVVRRAGEPPVELPGGSAANAAVALARLGVEVNLTTALGDDARGARLQDHLDREGVGLVGDPFVLERTATAEAEIGTDGMARYRFDIAWQLDPDVVGKAVRSAPEVLLVSSLAPVLAPGGEQVLRLAQAVGQRAAVVYDVNARPAITGEGHGLWAAVQAMASLTDLIKVSDEDLAVLHPGLSVIEAARTLLDAGARAVAVTLGADGSCWVDAHRVIEAPAVPVEVVDTIGAGDTFGAALVRSLIDADLLGPDRSPLAASDDTIGDLLTWAGRAAAVTVSRRGADPPTLAEVD